MRKIINGKRYDTETAAKMGYFRNNESGFRYLEETLYCKKTGEFFLHGYGGPSTKYAKNVALHEWTEGETIIPMSYDDARAWAENRLSATEYESIFGIDPEDNTKTAWTIRVSPSTIEQVKRVASDKGITLSEFVESAIIAYLK